MVDVFNPQVYTSTHSGMKGNKPPETTRQRGRGLAENAPGNGIRNGTARLTWTRGARYSTAERP